MNKVNRTSGGITGIVLAGGRARRMGGLDKGLQSFRGRALIEWVLERLAPQVDEVLISANRNLDAYGRFGYRVVRDEPGEISAALVPDGFPGPLAGVQAGFRAASHPWLLTVPCDAPLLPRDLAFRLRRDLEKSGALCAVASTGGRSQPVFSLTSRALASPLEGYLAEGGRAVQGWQRSVRAIEVAFDDDASGFAPLNTPEALCAQEAPDAG